MIMINGKPAAPTIVVGKHPGEGVLVNVSDPAYGWRDITSSVLVGNTNQLDPPAYTEYSPGIQQFQFGIGDQVWHVFHMPHDYVPGTDLFIHSHWSMNEVATAGAVVWGFDVLMARRDSEAFGAVTVGFAAPQACNITGSRIHQVAEVQITDPGAVTTDFDSNEIEVDGLLLVRSYLLDNETDKDPFLHTVDLHYQSNNIGTKNKESNFYE